MITEIHNIYQKYMKCCPMENQNSTQVPIIVNNSISEVKSCNIIAVLLGES